MALATATKPSPRFAALDAARGLALLAMFVFHLVWDLGFFGFIPDSVPNDPRFHGFGHAIAASFIGLAGIGLVLAARNGLNLRLTLKRIGLIAAAAALISLITYFLFPDAFIFFGILHLIGFASLCALPFLRAPSWLVGGVGALALVMPILVSLPVFDEPIWWWLGLGTAEPRSNDWRPFFPWFGVMLTGLLIGRAIVTHGLPVSLSEWQPRSRVGHVLVFGGRHSLAVYLLHQPVFLAVLFIISIAMGRSIEGMVSDKAPDFIPSCEQQCASTGGQPAICTRACGCIAEEASQQGLSRAVAQNRLTPAEKKKFDVITRQCVSRALSQPPP